MNTLNTTDVENQHIADAYDANQYKSNPFYYSSPAHIRATAHLYGVETVAVEHARVLELGCAAGGNLLPFAVAYPQSHSVGVDLSPLQIQEGQQTVQALGLDNLHLHAMSLTDITKDFGEFDYIIVHGVFSWVPPEVRTAILRIAKENLSPKGVAYISYNTYPGWRAGETVRDAMLMHSHSAANPDEKLASAKAMLTLLSDGLAASNPLGPSLRSAVAQLEKQSDYYIAHEYLEINNSPCYFLEFADAAQQAGLTYLGDAEAFSEIPVTYGQNVQLTHNLVALGQPKAMRQQYLDFATGRNFRKSLLIAQERQDSIANSPNLDRLRELRWAGRFTRTDAPVNTPANRHHYTNHRGGPLNTTDTRVIAVVQAVSKVWPASVSFQELVDQIARDGLLEGDTAKLETDAFDAVGTLYKLNQLRFTLDNDPYLSSTPNPVLIPGFAYLWQQAKGSPDFGIGQFNLWHELINIRLHDAEAYLLPYIDGKNTMTQLQTRLRDALQSGKVPNTDGKALTGQRNLDSKAQNILGKLMNLFIRNGVITSKS